MDLSVPLSDDISWISPDGGHMYPVEFESGRSPTNQKKIRGRYRYEFSRMVEQFGLKGEDGFMRNILWILGLGTLIWIGAHADAAIAPLMTAFKATGARASGYSVNDWVEVKHVESLPSLVQKLAKDLNLSGSIHKTSNVSYDKVFLSQNRSGVSTRVIGERLSTGAVFIVVDRTSSHGFFGLRGSERKFFGLLQPYGLVHRDINLEGSLPGHVSLTAQKEVVKKALQAVGAKDVNGITAPGYMAMSAHTPFISHHDSLDGHPVNMQVAVSYNSYLKATQVYVGTPLVTVTY